MAQETLPWQPILGSKLAKSDYSPLFVALAFRKRSQYRPSDFKKFICDDLATLCVILVNFGAVTPEFKRSSACTSPSFLKINPLRVETNYRMIYLTDFNDIFTVW